MKVLVINGPNLNMLGIREPELYGKGSYLSLVEYIKDRALALEIDVMVTQSNHEGDIIDSIQSAYGVYDGIVINAGGYTHTSVAILDALKAVGLPTVEVHITDINTREEFRRVSYVGMYAEKQIVGKGFWGYGEALEYLKERIR